MTDPTGHDDPVYPSHPSHLPGHLHPFDPGNCQWDAVTDQQRRRDEAFAHYAMRDAEVAREQERIVMLRAMQARQRAEAEAFLLMG